MVAQQLQRDDVDDWLKAIHCLGHLQMSKDEFQLHLQQEF